MPNKARKSVERFASIFIFSIVVAILALEAWEVSHGREAQLQQSSESLTNVAGALAQHANNTIKEADLLTLEVLERLQNDGTSQAGLERTHRVLIERIRQLPQLIGLYVTDEQGTVFVSSQNELQEGLTAYDRPYFLHHRDNPDSGGYIGLPLKSRSTGHWGFTFSRRYNKPNGTFGGVVAANINMDYFRKFYGGFNVGKAGAIVLARSDGMLLYRQPMREEFAGRNMSGTNLFREFRDHPGGGTALITSAQDGVARLNAYRGVDTYPLVVAAAMSTDEILADWWREVTFHASFVGLLLFVLIYAGKRLIDKVNRRLFVGELALEAQQKAEQENRSLEVLALQDALTGLPNRRQFDVMLKKEMESAKAAGKPVSFILMDVDDFKAFSHEYGHGAGEECLKKIANLIQVHIKGSNCILCRYDSEAFGAILQGHDLLFATALAEKLCEEIGRLAIPHWESSEGIVTLSIGVSSLDPVENGDLGSDLIRSADHALNTAKQKGKNRVVSFVLPKTF